MPCTDGLTATLCGNEQSQLQSKIHQQLKTFEDLRKSEQDLQLSIRYSSSLLVLLLHANDSVVGSSD